MKNALDQYMGDSTDLMMVLNNGRSAHECVKERTTYFDRLFQFVTASSQFAFFSQYSCLDHFSQSLLELFEDTPCNLLEAILKAVRSC